MATSSLPGRARASGLVWEDVRTLYSREVRSALRERSVVVNSILLPIVLYPVLLWIQFTAMAFVSGLSDSALSRVVILDPPLGHATLLDSLQRGADMEGTVATTVSLGRLLDGLATGDHDAVLAFSAPEPEGRSLRDNFVVSVHYDRSVERSLRTLDRVEAIVRDYRRDWIAREASTLGVMEYMLTPFEIEQRNVSSDEEIGATILGIMLPLFLVVAVALGCLVPAVDTTAGERERGTWETLMVTQASRASVVTSKYLYVASFGAAAGMLNVTAMTLALVPVMAPLQGTGGTAARVAVSLSPLSVAVMIAAATLLALFFAAAMMLLASFARSFKDGQALVTPVFYLALLPLLLGQQSDRALTTTLAMVPVANIAMAVRDAVNGVFVWPALAVTALVTLFLVGVCTGLARWVLGFEDFLLDTHGGSLRRFVRNRFAGGPT